MELAPDRFKDFWRDFTAVAVGLGDGICPVAYLQHPINDFALLMH
jgi:hypothetical protein